MENRTDSFKQAALYTGLAHEFLSACQRARLPLGALERLVDNWGNGHSTLDACVRKMMADYRHYVDGETVEEGFITVPDLPAEQLCRLLEEAGMSVSDDLKRWNFYLSTRNRRIGGRGKTYKFKVWTDHSCHTAEHVSEYFNKTGHDGHTGAFLTWAMGQRKTDTDGKRYVTILSNDTERCVGESESRYYECSPYYRNVDNSNRLSVSVDSTQGYTNGTSFVAFKEWKP
ncbi:hypothetical protein KBD34_02540 [Patescibacteria group bacterium]|nr:hypothetical protein [Patescibacteria group bacterium]